MAYNDFTLESAEARFALVTVPDDLFPKLAPLPVPTWLIELLARGQAVAALVGEKARSEFLVTPILLACRDLVPGPLSIYSGQRMDVDQAQGLNGECDYILARTPLVPRLRAPLVPILEAKRGDIELGPGQCVVQMVGARLFDERAVVVTGPVSGVVTTGEAWHFLRLTDGTVTLHQTRLFINNVGGILAALRSMLLAAPQPV